jgi:hypothetical protein
MALQFIITSYTESDRMAEVFGQLLFPLAGLYPTGGDSVNFAFDAGSAGVAGVNKNTASMPVFLQGQTGLHASRAPQRWNVQLESGIVAVLVPGNGPTNFKIKLWDPATKAELPNNTAYNGGTGNLAAVVFNTLDLQYKKNI